MTTASPGWLHVTVFLLASCGGDAAGAVEDGGHGPMTQRRDAAAGPASTDAGSRTDGGERDAGHDVHAEPPITGPGVFGVLLDHDRRPLAFAKIFACMTTVCLSGMSDASGGFVFAIEGPMELALKTLEDTSVTPRRGALLYPVQVRDRSPLNVRELVVPTLPAGVSLDAASTEPETLAVGDGLELTLRGADLTPRLGDELLDAAARAIPRSGWPTLPALDAEQIVAIYALHPFAAKSSSPIAVRAVSALTSGTHVRFWTISEVDGHLSPPVSGRADGNVVTTNPGSGIEELTWLVISRTDP